MREPFPSELHQALVELLKQRSVSLGSFTLASGRTSSFYIDARRTTMSARGMELVGRLGLWTIRDAGWEVSVVGGLTMGADPVALAIAAASRLFPPVIDAFSVRKQVKEHGAGRRIEGCYAPGDRAVIVEDVITTGQSALRAARAVAESGGTVVGVLAVVDRQEGGREAIEQAGYPVRALVTARDLGLAGQ
ncbi:MAG: orotate phosphoribosyltransferase [Gemmatimonadales bacterium]|nr:Orotate phosphoribosyltransferase [bacterium HR33]GIW52943.1 MAG: orotate phosphoribosyltransferase [Gemmatimonadales bacterium]